MTHTATNEATGALNSCTLIPESYSKGFKGLTDRCLMVLKRYHVMMPCKTKGRPLFYMASSFCRWGFHINYCSLSKKQGTVLRNKIHFYEQFFCLSFFALTYITMLWHYVNENNVHTYIQIFKIISTKPIRQNFYPR